MFGSLHLLLAAACVAALFTEGQGCVNATWGVQEGFRTTLRPVVIKAGVTHQFVHLEFPGVESRLAVGGCDERGSSAFACSGGDDVSLYFVSQFTLFVQRTNAANDLPIETFAYCAIWTV